MIAREKKKETQGWTTGSRERLAEKITISTGIYSVGRYPLIVSLASVDVNLSGALISDDVSARRHPEHQIRLAV